MIPILLLIAALAGAAAWIFVYFGHYWWMYWQQTRETVKAPRRPHWTTCCRWCDGDITDWKADRDE